MCVCVLFMCRGRVRPEGLCYYKGDALLCQTRHCELETRPAHWWKAPLGGRKTAMSQTKRFDIHRVRL